MPLERSYTYICFVYSNPYSFFLFFPLRLLFLCYTHYECCLPTCYLYYYFVSGIIQPTEFKFFDGNKCTDNLLKRCLSYNFVFLFKVFYTPKDICTDFPIYSVIIDTYIFYQPEIYFQHMSSCSRQYNAPPNKMSMSQSLKPVNMLGYEAK